MSMTPVSKPFFGFREFWAVSKCMRKAEISGLAGKEIPSLESEYSAYVGAEHSVAVNSGTSAIMLALRVLGIGPGDEVLVSSYTNMASFFPILQLGAIPIPIDVEVDSWNLDPERLEECISPRTKAILVVHIFGLPANMPRILEISTRHNLPIIEDCAEAHGATINGKNVGSFGVLGCFSFYANKLVSAGEGGLVTTNSPALADQMRSLRSLAFGKQNKFLHEDDGYNFRMSNLHAAIARVQLSKLPKTVERKRKIAQSYAAVLKDVPHIRLPIEPHGFKNVYWMFKVVLDEDHYDRAKVTKCLLDVGIETRPGFIPFSDQASVLKKFSLSPNQTPNASYLGRNSFYLPSGPKLSLRRVSFIANSLKSILKSS
jgi:perosamine synthetase